MKSTLNVILAALTGLVSLESNAAAAQHPQWGNDRAGTKRSNMKKATLVSTLLTAVVLLGCSKSNTGPSLTAASTPATTSLLATTPVVIVPEVRIEPGVLDLKATSIDIYRDGLGQPPQSVFNALVSLKTDKTTYENDAAYVKRMKGLIGERLLGETKVGDVIGFKPETARFSYDANKEQWQYELPNGAVDYKYHYVPVYRRSVDVNTMPQYTTAFPGRGIEIEEVIYLDISTMRGLSYINGFVKVAAKDASALEGKLSVLLVGRLTTPYTGTNHKFPLESSEHIVELQSTIGFKLESVWIINTSTGKILSKAWTYKRLA